jgi:hypothetical protein
MSELQSRQAAKLREIGKALEAEGIIGLDAQAAALGICRSTAWTIFTGIHKSSGLSVSTINRMLDMPLRATVRQKILEYVELKSAGHFGGSRFRLGRFSRRMEIALASPPSDRSEAQR